MRVIQVAWLWQPVHPETAVLALVAAVLRREAVAEPGDLARVVLEVLQEAVEHRLGEVRALHRLEALPGGPVVEVGEDSEAVGAVEAVVVEADVEEEEVVVDVSALDGLMLDAWCTTMADGVGLGPFTFIES